MRLRSISSMRPWMTRTLGVIFALSVWLATAPLSTGVAQAPSSTFDPNQVTEPASPPLAGVGRILYQDSCAPCHGPTGAGDGETASELPVPPTAFASPDAVWELPPAEMFHTTKFGRLENLMPPWQNQMTDEQIWQAVTFAWSLHTNEAETTAGAELYSANCAVCHGDTGAGDGPEATTDLPDFSDQSYAIAQSQSDWLAGWRAAHAEIGGDWSAAEQRAILEYIRAFTYVPPWESAYRPGNGVIRGTASQGTPEGPTVAGGQATLEAFLGFEPAAVFTTTIDADGHFEFTELAIDPNIVYLATVPSSGIHYSSPVVTLSVEQPEAEIDITVYEPTDDPAAIQIERAHWIIDFQPGILIAGQIVTFGNSGDHTIVGAPVEGVDVPVTIALHIPAEAVEVSFENGIVGERFQQVGDRYYDTTPVIPGDATKQIVVRYALPFSGDQATLEQSFLYPMGRLNLLVADLPQLEVEVSDLESGGSQDFQGRTYRIWQQEDVDAGTVTVSMRGLPAAGAVDPRVGADNATGNTTGSSGTTGNVALSSTAVPLLEPWATWLSAGLIVLGLGGAFTWSWRRGYIDVSDSADSLRQQYDELIRRIAHLDDLHILGDLNDEAWRTQRAALKARLLDVANRLAVSEQA